MNHPKLWEFLVEIQQTVLRQKKSLKDATFKKEKDHREHLLFLIDIWEKMDFLERRISPQRDSFDKKSLRVFNSFKIIANAILTQLEAHQVEPMKLDHHKIDPRLCEVVDGEETDNPQLKGTIKEVLSPGHLYKNGEVLRFARVVTYR